MNSLRRTALLWMTVLLGVVGLVAFAISYELARVEAADTLDGQLRQIALNAGEGLADAPRPGAKPDSEDEFIISIWSATGETLRSGSPDIGLPHLTAPGYATIQFGEEDWRVYLARDSRRSVQVAQRMSALQEKADTAAIQAAMPILVVIPLTWLIIGWSLGQVLGRLTRLAHTIAGRGVDSKEPISIDGVPVEVRPLIEAMNVLADRLQQALDRQRRFVSDAAHELRTPLAALRLQVDNLPAHPGDDRKAQALELSAGVRRASTLLDQLLRLARSENASGATAGESVDIAALVTQCVADCVPLATTGGVDLGVAAAEHARLSGSSGELKMLFGNLIDNAIRYTPAGGSVDVAVRRQGASFLVEILDTGCGVAETDLPRLFDRFFRAAQMDVEGSGLGLSIADAVAKRHGLNIKIINRSDRSGLRVRVSGAAEAGEATATEERAPTYRASA